MGVSSKIFRLASPLLLFVIQLLYIVAPGLAFAQTTSNTNVANPATTAEYKGGEASIRSYLCTPTDASEKDDGRNSDLYNCVNRLYRFGIAIGAAASVFLFVLAGYLYMTGEQKAIDQAKSIVISTLVGLALLLSTYILLRQINPELIKFKPLQLEAPTNVTAPPKDPKIPGATTK
jgi:hypothetical protein